MRHYGQMTMNAAHAESFFAEALDAGEVWSVRDADGLPVPKNAEGRRAMPFWSKKSRAERVVNTVPAYSGFGVVGLPLAEWRSRWLPGLLRHGLLVGLNWSGSVATGYDVEPQDVERSLEARTPPTSAAPGA